MLDNANYRNCLVGGYHDYKVLASNEGVQMEVCRYCKVEKDFSKMSEREYFLEHIRAFAQPSMACYYDINPNAMAKAMIETKEQKKFDARQGDLKEKFHFAIKRALKNEEDGIKKK